MIFNSDEDKTLHFIRQYHLDMFPHLLDETRFNRRRHLRNPGHGDHQFRTMPISESGVRRSLIPG